MFGPPRTLHARCFDVAVVVVLANGIESFGNLGRIIGDGEKTHTHTHTKQILDSTCAYLDMLK